MIYICLRIICICTVYHIQLHPQLIPIGVGFEPTFCWLPSSNPSIATGNPAFGSMMFPLNLNPLKYLLGIVNCQSKGNFKPNPGRTMPQATVFCPGRMLNYQLWSQLQ